MSRPVFVREMSNSERKQLRRLIRRGRDARMVRRAQMIWSSSQGKTLSQIAAEWQVCRQTVLNTVSRFNDRGIQGLADCHRGGRPAKATGRYIELLKAAVGTSPRDLGYPFTAWTLERLGEHLTRQTGVVLHPRYLSTLMSQHGIVYRRPKHGMAHLRDPQEYDEKRAFLEFVKRGRFGLGRPSTCCTSTNVKFISTRP
jgi:transposase